MCAMQMHDIAVPPGFTLGTIGKRFALILDGVAVPFSPGVSLATFLEGQSGGRLDDALACGIASRIAACLADIHERTQRRAADFHDERVWLGFDGTVALHPLHTHEFEALATSLTLDVWRLGALTAALVTGVRNVPPGAGKRLISGELTYEGIGTPPPLPDHTRPIVDRALRSADLGHARKIAAELAALATGVDVEAGLSAVLAGLFPVERARALEAQEELALCEALPRIPRRSP
jgi:hypothetical protein